MAALCNRCGGELRWRYMVEPWFLQRSEAHWNFKVPECIAELRCSDFVAYLHFSSEVQKVLRELVPLSTKADICYFYNRKSALDLDLLQDTYSKERQSCGTLSMKESWKKKSFLSLNTWIDTWILDPDPKQTICFSAHSLHFQFFRYSSSQQDNKHNTKHNPVGKRIQHIVTLLHF